VAAASTLGDGNAIASATAIAAPDLAGNEPEGFRDLDFNRENR
jgi:hypothetical protein